MRVAGVASAPGPPPTFRCAIAGRERTGKECARGSTAQQIVKLGDEGQGCVRFSSRGRQADRPLAASSCIQRSVGPASPSLVTMWVRFSPSAHLWPSTPAARIRGNHGPFQPLPTPLGFARRPAGHVQARSETVIGGPIGSARGIPSLRIVRLIVEVRPSLAAGTLATVAATAAMEMMLLVSIRGFLQGTSAGLGTRPKPGSGIQIGA